MVEYPIQAVTAIVALSTIAAGISWLAVFCHLFDDNASKATGWLMAAIPFTAIILIAVIAPKLN